MNSRFAKSAVFVGVVIIHALMVFIVSRIPAPSKERRNSFQSDIFFLDSPRRIATGVTPPEKSAHPSMMHQAEIDVPVTTSPEISTVIAMRAPIDWRAEGAQIALDIAQQLADERAKKTSLSKLKDSESTDFGEPETVFDKPLHQNGDTQHFDNGETITWTDDLEGRCYYTNQPSPNPRLDERAVVKICKHATRPVRDDLVKRAQPRYLQKEP